jgi:hypothetical protein
LKYEYIEKKAYQCQSTDYWADDTLGTGVAWGQILPSWVWEAIDILSNATLLFRFKTSRYGIFELSYRINLIVHHL